MQGEFPVGSRFYNEYPKTSTSTEYTDSNPFPFVNGTYFAIPPGGIDCNFEVEIHISPESTTITKQCRLEKRMHDGKPIFSQALYSY